MTEPPELVQNFPANVERRSHARHRVRSLAYVELGENNGGIVLNIGEGGFAVRAAEVLTEDRLPRLRFQMRNPATQLVTSGEIAWSSDSKKEAGVRFIDLPEESLLEIKAWISQEASPANSKNQDQSIARQSRRMDAATSEPMRSGLPRDQAGRISERGFVGNDASKSSVVRELTSEPFEPDSSPPSLERKRYASTLFVSPEEDPSDTEYLHGVAASSATKNPMMKRTAPGVEPSVNWLDFRIQIGPGWLVAAFVIFLAAISFAAGMLLRRGELIAPRPDVPDKASAQNDGSQNPVPTSASAGAPSKVWQIEIVDSSNRRWSIPGSAGAAHSNENSTGISESPRHADSAEDRATGSSGTALAGEKATPVLLSLPETSLGASQSVAISSQRSLSVPADPSAGSSQVGKNLHVGQLVNLVEPVYPPEAERTHIEGTVRLHVTIGMDGSIEDLQLISGPPQLIAAARTAVREWRYNPTLLNGQPIETQEDISLVFRLPK
jgi:TonB family protein